jgi:two-component system, NtrC family, sensor histidine kinase KinB
MIDILSTFLGIAGISIAIYSFWRDRKLRKDLKKKETDMSKRVYELSILKEVGDRVGYSLDVQQIVEVITSSLHQFLQYSAVSYMLLGKDKLEFKVHLERTVHREFIHEIRDRMLASFGALLEKPIDKNHINETISGSILSENNLEPVRSFFNIPIVINEKVVGMITVADVRAGLYKEEDMTILYKITQQASNAVTRLEQVVRTEQSKMNAMVQSMNDGVVMTDADNHIVVANNVAKKVIGINNDREVTIFEFFDYLEGKIALRSRLEESIKLQKSFTSERILIRDQFFQISVLPVIHSDDLTKKEDVMGGTIIFHNVTHEAELERVRNDFISMMVHELRAPLSAINKMSEVLQKPTVSRKKADIESRKEYTKLIHQNSTQMLELVNDILDLAKLEAGKFDVVPLPADFGDTIENRVEFFKMIAQDTGVELKAVTDKDLPKQALFDAEALKQVFNNFISNALKFTRHGGQVSVVGFAHDSSRSLEVELSKLGIHPPEPLPADVFASMPRSLVGIVIDNGTGIAVEHMGKLFNKFDQVKTKMYGDSVKGTGLGLAIAKGIIEEHKGKIGVVSQVGVGSAFYFVIPLQEVQQ